MIQSTYFQQKPPTSFSKTTNKKSSTKKSKQQQEPELITLPTRCQRGQMINSNSNQNLMIQSNIFQGVYSKGKPVQKSQQKQVNNRSVSKKKDSQGQNIKQIEQMTIKYQNRGKSPSQQQYFYDQIMENKSCVPNIGPIKSQETYENFKNFEEIQQKNLKNQINQNTQQVVQKQQNKEQQQQNLQQEIFQSPVLQNFQNNSNSNVNNKNNYKISNEYGGYGDIYLQKKMQKKSSKTNLRRQSMEINKSKNNEFIQKNNYMNNTNDQQEKPFDTKKFSASSSNFSPSKNKTESQQQQQEQKLQLQQNYIQNDNIAQNSPILYINQNNYQNKPTFEYESDIDASAKHVNYTCNIDNFDQIDQVFDNKQDEKQYLQENINDLNSNKKYIKSLENSPKININQTIQNQYPNYNNENINTNNINSQQKIMISENDIDKIQFTQQSQLQHSLSLQDFDTINNFMDENATKLKNKHISRNNSKKQFTNINIQNQQYSQSETKKKLTIKPIKSEKKSTQEKQQNQQQQSQKKKISGQFHSRLPSQNASPNISFMQKLNNAQQPDQSYQFVENSENYSYSKVNNRINELNNLQQNQPILVTQNQQINNLKIQSKKVTTPQKNNYSFFKSPNKKSSSININNNSNSNNNNISSNKNNSKIQNSKINMNDSNPVSKEYDIPKQQQNIQKEKEKMLSPDRNLNKKKNTSTHLQKSKVQAGNIQLQKGQVNKKQFINCLNNNLPIQKNKNTIQKSQVQTQRQTNQQNLQIDEKNTIMSVRNQNQLKSHKKIQSINASIEYQLNKNKEYQKQLQQKSGVQVLNTNNIQQYNEKNQKNQEQEQQNSEIQNEQNQQEQKGEDIQKQNMKIQNQNNEEQIQKTTEDELDSSNQNKNTINITNLSTTVDTSNLNQYSFNNNNNYKKQISIENIEEEKPQFEYPRSQYPKVQKIIDKINQHMYDPQPQYSQKELEILKNVHDQSILQNNYIFETDYNIHQFMDTNPQKTQEMYLQYRYKLNNSYFAPTMPAQIANNKKYTMVLDMDETLIHCLGTKEKKSDKYSVSELVILRPYVHYFLEEISKYYEIVLYTAAIQHYADSVIDQILDPEGKYISHRFYREHCRFYESQTEGVLRVKDISTLNRDMDKIILIDDKEENIILQEKNSILCAPWQGEQNDRFLYQLVEFLKSIVEHNGNVQIAIEMLKQNSKSQ